MLALQPRKNIHIEEHCFEPKNLKLKRWQKFYDMEWAVVQTPSDLLTRLSDLISRESTLGRPSLFFVSISTQNFEKRKAAYVKMKQDCIFYTFWNNQI